jgi:eukaryotic-like serine/threonine-protein kinase
MNQELSPNTTLSHYRIVSKIGAGGMGEVYLAQDTSELGRMVALKLLSAEVAGDKDRLQRFIQEARTVSNLNHPNILTVHEFGKDESTSFMATEYVEGVTLRQHVSGRKFKLVEVLDLAIQIVAALNAAHEAGVTHRDLKPENVMVRRDHIVKVLDFGLAKPSAPASDKQIDSEAGTRVLVHTEPGLVMGTVSYMSPEQSVGKGVDQRSDIWSVGVVLYEMIAGQVPFQGKDIHRQIIAIQEGEPSPLSQQVEGVPDRLEEIVTKCLAKEKDERYQSAKDLLIDLRNSRRKLDVDAEIERTVAPNLRNPSGTASQASTSRTQSGAGATIIQQRDPTSSVEYIVTGFKQHKLAAVVVALVLVAGSIGLGLFWRARTSNAGGAINSIAVLPFQNRSTDADTDYLSDGLAESLIYRLSQLPDLKVSPTSSVFRYKGTDTDAQKIGNELGVSAVMTGRIVKRGDNLTISVELVDVRNNKLLWGEQYERKMSELLTTQREIAGEIMNKLQVKLSGEGEQRLAKKYTDSNEAYQLYLKGRFYWNKRDEENIRKAIEQFKAAADKDPNFALAYIGLADSYVLLPFYSGATSAEVAPPAKAYAQRALEIDDSLGEAHTALGYVNRILWNWAEAEKELKRGVELNPDRATAHKFYGNVLEDLRRDDEALAEYKRAQELEPLSLIISANLSELYLKKGDVNSAAEQCHRAIELDQNWYYVHLVLSLVYLKQGRNAEALTEGEKSVELSKRLSAPLAVLGNVYAQTGKRAEAEALLKELQDKYARRQANGYDIARIYVGLGDKDRAFEWLEKDFQSRNATMPNFLDAPPLNSLRDDPRLKDLVQRTGLPELK